MKKKREKRFYPLLDIVLTVVLVVIYVPLSLWGGSECWAGATDFLPGIMLFIGAVYIVFESIRFSSPIIGAAVGGLVPLVTIGPSLFLCPEEPEAFIIAVVLGCGFGFTVSTVSWFIQRRKRGDTSSGEMQCPQCGAAILPKRMDCLKCGWSYGGEDALKEIEQRAKEKESPEGHEALASKYARRMLYGVLWAVGGTIVTVVAYEAASPGGTYIIAWGAIVFGIIDFFRGLFGWLKYKT